MGIIVAFELAPQPIPMTLVPGAGPAPTGVILINPTGAIALVGAGLAQPGSHPNFNYAQFSFALDLPAMTRDFLVSNHPTLLWQGFGLASSGSIHATGMVLQHY